ncbi:GNAT family N-acetyltransferase [Devosia sp. ZB163]|uniref:GNAT family N-acetyltransferase n=1 Tax=Devosia sp. ZB163 TaxID=3025938 RepID=UPI00235E88E2|nr:GNAT family N-acetyltransferase [Devosia sp. ZB163]MDC9822446.1 GNAT family N-acetyltransferase [Devosia sp. ZB163]
MTFAARRLIASDAEAYRALRIEGLADSPASFGSSLAEEIDKPAAAWVDRLDKGFVFGLFETGALVGAAGFYREAILKSAHRGHLVGVYLRPAARGRGGADLLVGAVIAEARNHVLQLHLAVTQDNDRARRLYERHGFTIYGEDPRGLRVDGLFYDDYLMVLRLDEGSGK